MKRHLLLPLLACAAASMLDAAPITCPTTATLAQLIALSGTDGGCISQDKLFNNFSYTTAGTTGAADVNATLVFQPGPNSQDIHGWIFAPGSGPWTTGFDLSYTISVVPGTNVVINAAKDQSNTGLLPNGDVVTDTQTPNTGSPMTLTTMGVSGGETAQVTFPAVTSITTSTVATVGSGNVLASYEQNWFEGPAAPSVPEPPGFTYGLLGGGFLLLGLMRFRKA